MIHYTHKNGTSNVTNTSNTWTFNYPCSSNYDCSPYNVTFPVGIYRFLVCGGQGGKVDVVAKKGGCSFGTIRIFPETTFYLYVGGHGSDSGQNNYQTKPGGFNGGGTTTNGAASGAGASDVRYTFNDLHSRIIVGGGSGGSNDYQKGGEGGGLQGGYGEIRHIAQYICKFEIGEAIGDGGTQTEGGRNATFGIGGGDQDADIKSFGGGGGGGWYGGGLGRGCAAAGGGGSGYISGHPECVENSRFFFTQTSFRSDYRSGNGIIKVQQLPITYDLNMDSVNAELAKAVLIICFSSLFMVI